MTEAMESPLLRLHPLWQDLGGKLPSCHHDCADSVQERCISIEFCSGNDSPMAIGEDQFVNCGYKEDDECDHANHKRKSADGNPFHRVTYICFFDR